MFIPIALLLGIVAGLRALIPIAVVSWSARLGGLALAGTPLAFMGYRYTPILLTALAAVELVTDKLPQTPSRMTPVQFIARIVSGSLAGATVGAAFGSPVSAAVAGALGAVACTYGGAAVREYLAKSFRRDLPAALIEDVFAIALSVLVASRI